MNSDNILQKSGLQPSMSVSKALKRMQRQMGLEETGKLDESTLDAMKQPRCGVVDVRNYQTFEGDLKWNHQDVTYRCVSLCFWKKIRHWQVVFSLYGCLSVV